MNILKLHYLKKKTESNISLIENNEINNNVNKNINKKKEKNKLKNLKEYSLNLWK